MCVRGKGKRGAVVGGRATQPRRAPPRRCRGDPSPRLGAPLTRHEDELVEASPRFYFIRVKQNQNAKAKTVHTNCVRVPSTFSPNTAHVSPFAFPLNMLRNRVTMHLQLHALGRTGPLSPH